MKRDTAPEERIPEPVFWDLAFLFAMHAEIANGTANAGAMAKLHADEAVSERRKRAATPAA